ncbi:MAG: hypothetical protein MSQ05_10325 [Akkermansia sp.]|nr:hypothetical protein [Akkermansia sp.]
MPRRRSYLPRRRSLTPGIPTSRRGLLSSLLRLILGFFLYRSRRRR